MAKKPVNAVVIVADMIKIILIKQLNIFVFVINKKEKINGSMIIWLVQYKRKFFHIY